MSPGFPHCQPTLSFLIAITQVLDTLKLLASKGNKGATMSASLSPMFLTDLAQVFTTLRPQALSPAFLSDLAQVHATLPVASDDNLLSLANRFHD